MKQITLPGCAGTPAGPVHTIAVDASGNIFYSDELNHSVVSLNPDGSLRWHRSEPGSKAGAFHYPRGISLGVIHKEEKFIECLAVCDSWNHRVQFLDIAGNPIESWHKAGNRPFLEPCDVRFIPVASNSGRGTDPGGYWLILDRESHSLSAIGPDGRFLFQIGRRFPTSLQDRWAIPGMLFEKDPVTPGYVREFPLFDFCFYPSRLLGNSEGALYIWEPRPRELKQVLLSNFLPVRSFSKDIEWIAADRSGMMGRRQDTNRLFLYYSSDQSRHEIEFSGVPVPSNLPLNQVWVQKGDCFERCLWDVPGSDPAAAVSQILHSPLRNSAETELKLRDENLIRKAVAEWAETVDKELACIDRLVSLAANTDTGQSARIAEETKRLADKRNKAERVFCDSVHHWSLGLLEWHFSVEDAGERAGRISAEQQTWDALIYPVGDHFKRIQDGLDSLLLLRTIFPENRMHQSMLEAAASLESDLENILEWIYRWTAVREAVTGYLPIGWVRPVSKRLSGQKQAPGHAIHRSDYRHHPPQSTPLREVNTLQLTRGGERFNPLGLACSSRGDLYVSSHNPAVILHLDPEGKILESIGGGIINNDGTGRLAHLTLDRDRRLWAADFANHRIMEFDLENHSFIAPPVTDVSAQGKLTSPYSIIARPDGSLLVTDANRCIARITSGGEYESFYSRIGRHRAELLEPVSFCNASEGGFWVVDRRNHRLLRLDDTGAVVEEMGGCGLGEGELFMPEAAAEFRDRTVAVAQNKYLRSIKLFSSSGTETGKLLLNYFAPSMLVFEERLFVADMSFGLIHVYERQN